MSRAFASQADLADKVVSFEALGPGLYATTAAGDPNSGVIVREASVMVVDVPATPAMPRNSRVAVQRPPPRLERALF